MKKLHFRRHSIKGTDNLLTPEGIALAVTEGDRAADDRFGDFEGWHDKSPNTKIFHGPLPRTIQTAFAFSRDFPGVVPMPAVVEIGTDDVFTEMTTPELEEVRKNGMPAFEAVLEIHGEQAKVWAKVATTAVKKIFGTMESNETAIAFGHDPLIQLAAWHFNGHQLSLELQNLGYLEGIILAQNQDGVIHVERKITVK